ncbi:50S ribosomal protein L25 [Clostridium celatum]|uniref:Large ribosomal subunit protein bL25 n=1 Tax=Clostridium celatum DSM 1785 TaxID=545697 RepID=L1Q3E7_9CLOT|nr:50S ribosomal protein L25 [Clostridium celatum]EKY22132.1 ribosomal protein L25, Ctc-form [Clostridium celatum DSM 1785]MCE9654560.1 50S ribosomal protein L25 [Clostridium celatum]MDU3722244.1 50S ribosomal protein L25 [Clostridium celatum]MDU6294803.1 50S ribosomal protein L25 [Clostridium celatum]MDY3359204.1 50S ribosomal protein L25 [Clostridium celatum]
MSNLEMNKRNADIPNSAKKARKNGKVPGVLYGKKINNLLFEVGELELAHEIGVNGEHGVISFDLDGEEHKGLIKEVQRDPVTNKIIHLDLEELKGKNKIISSVPIHYVGEDYINQRGIVLQKEKDSVKVECSVENLPKHIDFNVGSGNVGSVYKFGDLEVASEISILDDLNSVIASISYERKTVSDEMDEIEESAASE